LHFLEAELRSLLRFANEKRQKRQAALTVALRNGGIKRNLNWWQEQDF